MAVTSDKDGTCTRIVTGTIIVDKELTTSGFEETIEENPSPTR